MEYKINLVPPMGVKFFRVISSDFNINWSSGKAQHENRALRPRRRCGRLLRRGSRRPCRCRSSSRRGCSCRRGRRSSLGRRPRRPNRIPTTPAGCFSTADAELTRSFLRCCPLSWRATQLLRNSDLAGRGTSGTSIESTQKFTLCPSFSYHEFTGIGARKISNMIKKEEGYILVFYPYFTPNFV